MPILTGRNVAIAMLSFSVLCLLLCHFCVVLAAVVVVCGFFYPVSIHSHKQQHKHNCLLFVCFVKISYYHRRHCVMVLVSPIEAAEEEEEFILQFFKVCIHRHMFFLFVCLSTRSILKSISKKYKQLELEE